MAHYLVVAAMVWDIAYSKRKWLQRQIAGWGRARVWKKHPDTLRYHGGTESQSGSGTDGAGGRVLAQQSNEDVPYTHPTPHAHHRHTGGDGGTKRVSGERGRRAPGMRCLTERAPRPRQAQAFPRNATPGSRHHRDANVIIKC